MITFGLGPSRILTLGKFLSLKPSFHMAFVHAAPMIPNSLFTGQKGLFFSSEEKLTGFNPDWIQLRAADIPHIKITA